MINARRACSIAMNNLIAHDRERTESTGRGRADLHVHTLYSDGGQSPALAVSGDGKTLVVPFYDSLNHQLAVVVPAVAGFALGVPSPTPSPPATAPTGPPCSPTSNSTALSITAPTGAGGTGFTPTCLAVIPSTAFTVAFNDQDATAPHNWELFSDTGYTKRVGGAASASDTVTGPATKDYQLTALGAGLYYFRCDIHPTTMTGVLVVAKPGRAQPSPSGSP